MPRTKPFQPLILRLIHGTHALLVLVGVITGFWIYNTWDKRFGYLSLPNANQSLYYFHIDLENYLYIILPAFAIYSLWAGRHRLLQPNSLKQLRHIGKPIWWYTLHRIVNTGLLTTSGIALVSGKAMIHNGVLKGILTDFWYSLHLVSWVAIVFLFTAHLLMIIKVGGMPLMLSIVNLKIRTWQIQKRRY